MIYYREVFLVIDHLLDVVSHEHLCLIDNILRLADLIVFLETDFLSTEYHRYGLSAMIKIRQTLNVTAVIQVGRDGHLVSYLPQQLIGCVTFEILISQH
jgi:hypothetical protein